MTPADATASDARLQPVAFGELEGWAGDDHGAALRAFRRTCEAVLADLPPLRPASAAHDLRPACEAGLRVPDGEARAFFERWFSPARVVPASGAGFLTGYFEPEYEGALEPGAGFATPLLARPDDLVTIPQGETAPGLPPGLQAARRGIDGVLEPYPDRAAIENGALGALARPIVWMRHPSEAFIIHVQGSARVRLPDGGVVRVAYAGRNGHPFTAIGRILVERGEIPLPEMNLERLVGWLKDHPDAARDLMRQNRSYIFFRRADELDPADGPIGGAGVPLTPGRSLAVDRTLWSYGLPVWLTGELPRPEGAPEPLARLMIAQDTGSAIVGPARGDFFWGSGAEAGTRAGLTRQRIGFTVLLPRPAPAP
ncbi:murein transglycosylase A [Salinarimonas soli]|nr:MltA domain-containing protein [Salinarimonas soli]